ncbi:MAG: AMP-binding protein [Burkholderiaceae bacterium]
MRMHSVHQAFRASAARTPQAEFLYADAVTARTYGIPQRAWHWGEADAEVERLRAAYERAGWGHGHRVGLLLENRPAFLLHWFALNALGVSVVPINADMRSAELTYLIGHSEIGLAVTLPERAADLLAAARQAGRTLRTLDIGDVGEVGGGDRAALDSAGADPFPSPPSLPPRAGEPVGLATECALLYTSGTTGRPKGCMLSNDYFVRAGQWYAGLDELCTVRRDRERVITPLPLTHVNAMAFSTMVVLVAGGCLIQLDRFHPKSWWQSVRDSGATIVHYLGVMPAMLLAAPPSADDREHQVRIGFGAGVDRKNHAPFEQRFGFPLLEAWAMTETGAAACVMANREPRHVGSSCFGRAEPFMDYRLVDDDGRDVEVGTPGELLVRSTGKDPRRYFFSGYLKDEAATQEAWAGGWFHTGDIVRSDADGNLYFVDRKKNVIRRSGENISAVEVESVLNQHPAVKSAAVAATPDPVRGDEVLACVVTHEPVADADRAALAASIVEHALAQLAYYKAPGYVAFVEALPLTVSQKIQRGELKQMAHELPGRECCVDVRSMKRRG